MASQDIRIALIGGTGLGEALGLEQGERIDVDTPFGKPSAPIIRATLNGVEVFLLQRHGEGHRYNPTNVPYQANIFALKKLGVTHIIAASATGSLQEKIKPRDLVIPDQVVDKTYRRPNTFFDCAAVHVDFSSPFCSVVREWILAAAERVPHISVHKSGTYVAMEGPVFSTRAESTMHHNLGFELIGMTAMPEAKLAREAEIAYGMVCYATDYDCWRPVEGNMEGEDLLNEIIGNMKAAVASSMELIKAALADTTLLREKTSRAHSSLKLGIWSRKDAIPQNDVDRLAVLWGHYFEKSS